LQGFRLNSILKNIIGSTLIGSNKKSPCKTRWFFLLRMWDKVGNVVINKDWGLVAQIMYYAIISLSIPKKRNTWRKYAIFGAKNTIKGFPRLFDKGYWKGGFIVP
jgi:hypothetical protein